MIPARASLPVAVAWLLPLAACRSVPPDPEGLDPDFRRKAAQNLAGESDDESVQWLLLLLTDTHVPDSIPHPTVRSAAARSLGLTGVPSVAPHLSKAVESDASDEVRMDAAVALGDLGAPEGIPALRAALGKASEAVKVRRAAADALGRLRAQEAVPDLTDAVRDPDRSVALAAQRALAAIAGEKPSRTNP